MFIDVSQSRQVDDLKLRSYQAPERSCHFLALRDSSLRPLALQYANNKAMIQEIDASTHSCPTKYRRFEDIGMRPLTKTKPNTRNNSASTAVDRGRRMKTRIETKGIIRACAAL